MIKSAIYVLITLIVLEVASFKQMKGIGDQKIIQQQFYHAVVSKKIAKLKMQEDY